MAKTSSGPTALGAAAAISEDLDTRSAALEAAGEVGAGLGVGCDVAMVFGSFHHRAAFAEAAKIVRARLEPQVLIGVTTEAVVGGDVELEGSAGMSVLAMRLGGARVHAFGYDPRRDGPLLNDAAAMRERIGFSDDLRAVVMVADPFSTPMSKLLPTMTMCGGEGKPVPVLGGMASGSTQPGGNVVVLNEDAGPTGAAAVTISGDVEIGWLVSQGCRPIGRPMVVTKVHGNVIQEIGGQKPMSLLQEMAGELTEAERAMLSKGGLLIGLVINEYKERFGRGDFLVRNVLSADKQSGAIAVGDMPRVGQTVQFHVRDAETASEDLQLLLDAEELAAKPFAAMLFTCNSRGEKLFGEKHHDVRTVRSRLDEPATAGFFAAGEIGPVGGQSFLHGHTAVLGMVRAG